MEFTWSLLLLPFIAGTIGWFTNFIAVKMLFHPRKPIKILFFTFQGIFPKRQAEIATSVGKMVANDLLRVEDLQQKLSNKDSVDAIVNKIETTLDNYFEIKFPLKFPLLSKVISPNIRQKIKEEMLGEVEHMAPKLIENQVKSLTKAFDIEQIVKDKVTSLAPEKLEELMMSIIEKELKFVELVGAVLGFFIGLVQIGLVVVL